MFYKHIPFMDISRVLHWVSATGGGFFGDRPPLVGGDTQGGDKPNRGGTLGGTSY